MLVPILQGQGVQEGHRQMQQNYAVQNDLREMRSQFSVMNSRYEDMLTMQRTEIRTQMKKIFAMGNKK